MIFLFADICSSVVEEGERVRNLSTCFKKLRKNMEVSFFNLFCFVFGCGEMVLSLDFFVVAVVGCSFLWLCLLK